jgi:hypothetical protein
MLFSFTCFAYWFRVSAIIIMAEEQSGADDEIPDSINRVDAVVIAPDQPTATPPEPDENSTIIAADNNFVVGEEKDDDNFEAELHLENIDLEHIEAILDETIEGFNESDSNGEVGSEISSDGDNEHNESDFNGEGGSEISSDGGEVFHECKTENDAGCEHYRRHCEIKAPCCGEWFSCRLCHDKVKSTEETDFKKQHTVNRHEIAVMRCVECKLEQPVSCF